MRPQAFFSRAAAGELAEGSKDRALATLALRRLWHVVFDPCLELSRLFGERNREFLDPFLEYASDKDLSMRWSLHLHLLAWLRDRQPAAITPSLTQELIAAAAARWANEDQSADKGAILHAAGMKGEALVVWKLRSPSEDSRVLLVKIPEQKLPGADVYFTTFPTYDYPETLTWRPVPD